MEIDYRNNNKNYCNNQNETQGSGWQSKNEIADKPRKNEQASDELQC